MRRLALVLVLAGYLVGALAGPARAAAPVDEASVMRISSQLRCVVCQNLSVADSPSEMARQMRDVVREHLRQGESEAQVLRYFEERYGEWIRLSPRGWLVWILPFAGLFVGLGVVLAVTRRWSRRAPGADPEAISPEDRDRIRLELERLGD